MSYVQRALGKKMPRLSAGKSPRYAYKPKKAKKSRKSRKVHKSVRHGGVKKRRTHRKRGTPTLTFVVTKK
jgi:hypothetical protein